ncbi:MAG: hypothetical protein ACKV19_27205 [Verrucomicrobiales bacterium]
MSLAILLALSFLAQEFIPAVPWAYEARLHLVPVVFFACAVAVPFPLMLLFAFSTGFLWDARHLVIDGAPMAEQVIASTAVPDTASPAFGYSIVLYGLLGSLMQGIRPLFRRGRWELPVLMCGLGTALLLTIEHLWFCFLRGRFFFSDQLWLHIGTTALLSMMISPVIFFLVHTLSRLSGYQIRYDGLDLRRPW